MVKKEKPYVLFVAEIIYLEILKIKKDNNFTNVDAIDNFIGSEIKNKNTVATTLVRAKIFLLIYKLRLTISSHGIHRNKTNNNQKTF